MQLDTVKQEPIVQPAYNLMTAMEIKIQEEPMLRIYRPEASAIIFPKMLPDQFRLELIEPYQDSYGRLYDLRVDFEIETYTLGQYTTTHEGRLIRKILLEQRLGGSENYPALPVI